MLCPKYSSSHQGMASHTRKHIGICLRCPYCETRFFFASSSWDHHMQEKHHGLPWFLDDMTAEFRATLPITPVPFPVTGKVPAVTLEGAVAVVPQVDPDLEHLLQAVEGQQGQEAVQTLPKDTPMESE